MWRIMFASFFSLFWAWIMLCIRQNLQIIWRWLEKGDLGLHHPNLPYGGYIYPLSISVSNCAQGSSCLQKASQLVWYRWKVMYDCLSKPITQSARGFRPRDTAASSDLDFSTPFSEGFTSLLLSWSGMFSPHSPCGFPGLSPSLSKPIKIR